MRPLLAATIKDVSQDVILPCYASPKVDGVRCLAFEGAAMSRSFKQLPNRAIREMFCDRRLHGFDGELVDGSPVAVDCFNRTTSTVMTQIASIERLNYFVFDDFSYPGPYEDRLNKLMTRVAQLSYGWLIVLPQRYHPSRQSLLDHEQEVVTLGYEGLMVRSINGLYKQGRSTLNEQFLMKLKRFTDAEAVCVGFKELYRNENEATISETGYQVRSSHKAQMVPAGTLGALRCHWAPTGEEFNIGTGFSEADREALWAMRDALPGRLVKFKYQNYGVVELPRLPVFVGFRDKEDT